MNPFKTFYKRIVEKRTDQRFTKVSVYEHDLDYFLAILKKHGVEFMNVNEEPDEYGIVVEYLASNRQNRKITKDSKYFRIRIQTL